MAHVGCKGAKCASLGTGPFGTFPKILQHRPAVGGLSLGNRICPLESWFVFSLKIFGYRFGILVKFRERLILISGIRDFF
jgi:hypothetical protein